MRVANPSNDCFWTKPRKAAQDRRCVADSHEMQLALATRNRIGRRPTIAIHLALEAMKRVKHVHDGFGLMCDGSVLLREEQVRQHDHGAEPFFVSATIAVDKGVKSDESGSVCDQRIRRLALVTFV